MVKHLAEKQESLQKNVVDVSIVWDHLSSHSFAGFNVI